MHNALQSLITIAVPPWNERAVLDDTAGLCQEAGFENVAVMIQAHPEDPPLLDKIRHSTDQFMRIKERLATAGVKAGILVQTLIDHGERGTPLSPVEFQRLVGADGRECRACFCPLDHGFLEHTGAACEIMAAARPAFILLEDDVRLESHGPANHGCCCPLHLRLLAERLGRVLTRAELVAGLARDDVDGLALRVTWHAAKRDSILRLVKTARAGIDRVDSNIRGGVCLCSCHRPIAPELVLAIAGTTRPLARVGGAFYGESGNKYFPAIMGSLEEQCAVLPPDCEILSEADTWPHNPHSLAATSLRAYAAGAHLAGTDVAEHWFTNALDPGPADSLPYRRMLAESREFLAEFARLARTVDWQGPIGCTHPLENVRKPHAAEFPSPSAWATAICGRLGIPSRTNGTGSIHMLAGETPLGFERPDLEKFLAGGLLLDGEAAGHLARLGFATTLGVRVEPGDDVRVNFEEFGDDPELHGNAAGRRHYIMRGDPASLRRLVPIAAGCRVGSWLIRWPGWHQPGEQRSAPALTLFENTAGGRVAVYAHSLRDMLELNFLTTARREQLAGVLAWLGREPLPVVVESPGDVYVRFGRLRTTNRQVLAIFNLSPDSINPLRFRLGAMVPHRIERLTDAGRWCDQSFKTTGLTIETDLNVPTMRPLLLRLLTAIP